MTRPSSEVTTFGEAAHTAEYEFYELAEPKPSHRWAGGYGTGSSGIIQLEILCAVDNQTVSVATEHVEVWPDLDREAQVRLFWRRQVDAVLNARLGERGPEMPGIELPITIELVEENRDISVDGSMTEFRCVRVVDADAWAGLIEIDDNRLVRVFSQGPPIRSIRTCTNWAMPDGPPRSTSAGPKQ